MTDEKEKCQYPRIVCWAMSIPIVYYLGLGVASLGLGFVALGLLLFVLRTIGLAPSNSSVKSVLTAGLELIGEAVRGVM